jgi:hypothetical protein
MCEHSLQEAVKGFEAMRVNAVVSTNHRAVALWKRHGFAIIGTVPRPINTGFWDQLTSTSCIAFCRAGRALPLAIRQGRCASTALKTSTAFCISGIVPNDSRAWLVSGGNGRPIATFCARHAA